MNLRLYSMAAIAAAGLTVGSALAQMPVVSLSAGVYLIRAETAYTYETRSSGLMYRETLGVNEGMLFVFPQTERHCMWMKNTLIPLAVAFMDEKGRIVSISEMRPQTENSHCATAPAKYALEMNSGWFSSRGIRAGVAISGLDKVPDSR
jgi:uncharacterized membrane protein (UPF0127 family)